MTGIQVALINSLQAQAAWLAAPMLLFSLLGQPEFFLLAIAYLYWCLDPRLGLRLGLLMGISGGLNEILKVAFHLPRPYWADASVKAFAAHPSFGFPSGHTQGAVTFWGLIALEARRRWFTILAIALIALIGISRVFLGAHLPIDIIAGAIFGLVILGGFLALEEPIRRRVSCLSLLEQISLAFAGSLILILGSWAAFAVIGDWQVPAAWAEGAIQRSGQSIDPLDPARLALMAGFFFGFAAGAAVEQSRQKLARIERTRRDRLLCYTFGIVVAGLIWYIPGFFVPAESVPATLAYALQYLRAAATAAWISYGAPAALVHKSAATHG